MSQGRLLCRISKNAGLRKVLSTSIARLGTAQHVKNHQTDIQSKHLSDETLKEHEDSLLDSDKGKMLPEILPPENIGHIKRLAGEIPGQGPPPESPVYCCMSGCNNCVWLDYIEEMKAYYQDGGSRAREAIDEIPDETVKTFLKMELGNK